ncbi:MAG: hypothetical protein AAFY03_04095, partial [Pseudomonadota bacterium]
ERVTYLVVEQTGSKDFRLVFGLQSEPDEDDLDALSLVESEVIADVWEDLGTIKHGWLIDTIVPDVGADQRRKLVYPAKA